jgi:hypothetical protein
MMWDFGESLGVLLLPLRFLPDASNPTVVFYILLTVHLNVILVNDQLDVLFSVYLFHASTCFEQQVLIIRRIKLCQYIIWYNIL